MMVYDILTHVQFAEVVCKLYLKSQLFSAIETYNRDSTCLTNEVYRRCHHFVNVAYVWSRGPLSNDAIIKLIL